MAELLHRAAKYIYFLGFYTEKLRFFPLASMLFSVIIGSEDEIPKMQETTGYFTVISFSFQNVGFVRFKAYEPLCLFSIRDCLFHLWSTA